MQMLCTDKVYRERRRCQELNAIEAGSLTEQVLKRSIFKHVIVMIFVQIWFRFWFCRYSEVAEGLVLVLLVLNFMF